MQRRSAVRGSAVAALLLVSSIALGDKSTCDDINALPPACGFDFEYWKTPGCGIGIAAINVYGINDAGTIVGKIEGCPTSTQYRILVWPAGQPTGQVINLPWSVSEWATDINNLGQITLYVIHEGKPTIAVMEGESITVLPKPEWASIADTGWINDHGVVVGRFGDSVIGPYPLLGQWDPPYPAVTDLSEFFEGASSFWPIGVTNSGYAAGTMLIPGDELHHYRRRAFLLADGKGIDIGLPPGALNSFGRGLNEHGHIAGYGWGNPSGTPGFGSQPWKGFVWRDGEFEMLTPFPLDAPVLAVEVNGINSAGTIIGRTLSYTDVGGPAGAVTTVWYDGTPYRIHDLVDVPASVNLGAPWLISDTGVIGGSGTSSGLIVFRMTPRHRPLGDLNLDCAVNQADLMTLLDAWGEQTARGVAPVADLNGDGVVNGADLGILLSNWSVE